MKENQPKRSGKKRGRPRGTTDAVVAQRVAEVLTIRLQGAQFHDIREYAKEQGWGIGDNQLYVYLQKTHEALEKRIEKTRDQEINYHLAQRRAIAANAMRGGDFSNALKALDSEAKLLGLFEQAPQPAAQAVQVNVGIIVDERRTALLALADRFGVGDIFDAIPNGDAPAAPKANGSHGSNGHHANGNGKPHLNGGTNGKSGPILPP